MNVCVCMCVRRDMELLIIVKFLFTNLKGAAHPDGPHYASQVRKMGKEGVNFIKILQKTLFLSKGYDFFFFHQRLQKKRQIQSKDCRRNVNCVI